MRPHRELLRASDAEITSNVNDVILTLNAGSSSIKFGLYTFEGQSETLIWRGHLDLSRQPSRFIVTDLEQREIDWQETFKGSSYQDALSRLLRWLVEQMASFRLVGVGHRLVHGGVAFNHPVIINEQVMVSLEKLAPLAPLHQPPALEGIRAIERFQRELPQVACFDTAFHRTMPFEEQVYALPIRWSEKGIRRYGFHGLSYEYIANILPDYLGDDADGRVLVAHLGHGASLCALKQRKSVGTTMGFSPLEGMPMSSRCGNLDPAVLLYLMREERMDIESISDLLHHHSGLLGLSGISGDMRELLASDEPRAQQTVRYFVWQVSRQIGALTAILGGLDALVFTAGIGEHAPVVRSQICRQSSWLGMELDEAANSANLACISAPASRVKVWVLPTDEERMIAHHTYKLLADQRVITNEKEGLNDDK
ncbi:acetate kinase [Nitrosomonas nitrosa]|nr:acetate kinase [Nitrosomonas nitrosa]